MTFILTPDEKKLIKYIINGKKRFRLLNGIYRIHDSYMALLSKRLCITYSTTQNYVTDFKQRGLVRPVGGNRLKLTETGLKICKAMNSHAQQNPYLQCLRRMSEGLEACIYTAGGQDEVNYAEVNYYNAQFECVGQLIEEFELLSAKELTEKW